MYVYIVNWSSVRLNRYLVHKTRLRNGANEDQMPSRIRRVVHWDLLVSHNANEIASIGKIEILDQGQHTNAHQLYIHIYIYIYPSLSLPHVGC